MVKYENQCVGCPTEMGCLGKACPYVDVPVYLCDECGDDAEYIIEGQEYCENCANKYMQEVFNDFTVLEKAELFDISIASIE